MFPHHPAQSAEMLRRILIESNLKQENSAGDQTQQGENFDGPIDDVSAAGRIGYSWDSVIADRMLSAAAPVVHRGVFRPHDSMLAGSSALGNDSDGEVAAVAHELTLSPHDLEEDVTDEADQSEMLGLSIDNDSSSMYLLTE